MTDSGAKIESYLDHHRDKLERYDARIIEHPADHGDWDVLRVSLGSIVDRVAACTD